MNVCLICSILQFHLLFVISHLVSFSLSSLCINLSSVKFRTQHFRERIVPRPEVKDKKKHPLIAASYGHVF